MNFSSLGVALPEDGLFHSHMMPRSLMMPDRIERRRCAGERQPAGQAAARGAD